MSGLPTGLPKHKETVHIYGDISRPLYLPFPQPFRWPKEPDSYPVLPTLLPESCASKIILGGLMGSVLGIGMGLFMGAMGDNSAIQILQGREVPQAPLREQVRSGFKSLLGKSRGWAKSFGILTALFGGVECLIEKSRARHDVWNPMLSGCAVGGAMGAKGGPGAACMGCVGFAGFSFLMEKVMGPH